MPRFIQVQLQCDWDGCDTTAEEGSRTVVERTVAIDNKQPRAFLVCEKHSQAVDDILMPLVSKGVKKAPSAKTVPADESIVCAACGKTCKGNVGLSQHVIRTHGYTSLDEYRSKHSTIT